MVALIGSACFIIFFFIFMLCHWLVDSKAESDAERDKKKTKYAGVRLNVGLSKYDVGMWKKQEEDKG